MNSNTFYFPTECNTPGQKISYLSKHLVTQGQIESYLQGMSEILDDNVHYLDPVHELKGKANVLAMFKKVVPRVGNSKFDFELIEETPSLLIWKWTIALKIRFTWFTFVINGLVHAKLENGKIIYQREYYDPMESIGVIPLVGFFYKLILKMG
jgi:limonene-1,2-epoxide hydrolase